MHIVFWYFYLASRQKQKTKNHIVCYFISFLRFLKSPPSTSYARFFSFLFTSSIYQTLACQQSFIPPRHPQNLESYFLFKCYIFCWFHIASRAKTETQIIKLKIKSLFFFKYLPPQVIYVLMPSVFLNHFSLLPIYICSEKVKHCWCYIKLYNYMSYWWKYYHEQQK